MTEDTRDSIKMDDKQDKDRDPSIRIDDKYQDPWKRLKINRCWTKTLRSAFIVIETKTKMVV